MKRAIKSGSIHRAGFRRSGTAIMEMAVMLVLLAYVCFGVVEFGGYFTVKNAMENCAREGCRAGIGPGAADADVTSAVVTHLIACKLIAAGSTTPSPYTITTSPSSVTSASVGSTFSCTVSGSWGTVGGFYRIYSIIPTSKTVSGTCAMRKEG